jgi:hypothetical protein
MEDHLSIHSSSASVIPSNYQVLERNRGFASIPSTLTVAALYSNFMQKDLIETSHLGT